jgi:hypothetical protein
MWQRQRIHFLSILTVLIVGEQSRADFPDTMIASLNTAGFITDFNDDGGTWEGSLGSGLTNIPINNDSSFWFLVTGNPDFDFEGDHDESGAYHVYVDIFDDFGFLEETIEYDATLAPGEVHQFSMDGFNTFYTYNVEIDNTVGGGTTTPGDFDGDSDVDGRDFLVWQRGNSPSRLSAGDLLDWRNNYGTGGLGAVAVPEPGTLLLLVAAACGLAAKRSSSCR